MENTFVFIASKCVKGMENLANIFVKLIANLRDV